MNRKWTKGLFRLGIDTGGTFTDFACLAPGGEWMRWKTLSTPDDPSRAILEGIARLVGEEAALEVVHGTTVGTNAFLERKGARTALVTTKGFEDILWIGRQARPSLYDLDVTRPPEIIARRSVTGVAERVDWRGDVLRPLAQPEVERAVRFCRARGAESVAVCLLHSYANPLHERLLKQALESTGIPACASHEVIPEFREFERFSTTLINAYLNPVVGRYIQRLEGRLPGARIFIQLSNGGALPAAQVGQKAVHTLLSGPAGGVEAAWRLAGALGIDKIVTLDMGGTSTDVSICPGGLTYTREYEIEGFPVAVPMLDIHTVGAGGGSIAWLDRGGFLQVGPESAGADPGPVCYGKGHQITVTDANLFLGRLRESSFLGGRMRLHSHAVETAMAALARQAGLSPLETALGIIELVNANMARAIRHVSLERGYDPREFTLVCFGGAAGLHAAELAEALGMKRILIPAMAGVFSAQGMAGSSLSFDTSRSIMVKDGIGERNRLAREVDTLVQALRRDLEQCGYGGSTYNVQLALDARYKGQSFEITVPFDEDWPERFAQEHSRLYGYHLPSARIEVTTVRARIEVERWEREEGSAPAPAQVNISGPERAKVVFREGAVEALILPRSRLTTASTPGPCVVTDEYTTILVPSGWRVASKERHVEMIRS